MKKWIGMLAILLGTSGIVYAGVQISYVMNKTVDQAVTVGNTTQYTDGIVVSLIDTDKHTLRFLTLDETDTSKWEITYTYGYEILVDGLGIEISSLTDDIVVLNDAYVNGGWFGAS